MYQLFPDVHVISLAYVIGYFTDYKKGRIINAKQNAGKKLNHPIQTWNRRERVLRNLVWFFKQTKILHMIKFSQRGRRDLWTNGLTQPLSSHKLMNDHTTTLIWVYYYYYRYIAYIPAWTGNHHDSAGLVETPIKGK